MDVFCTGCGAPLGPDAEICAECQTPAQGARFAESAAVETAGMIQVPPKCCCCLKPVQVTTTERLPVSFDGVRQVHILVQVPWCRPCRRRRIALFGATLVAFVAGSVASIVGIAALRDGDMPTIYLLGGVAAGGIAAGLVRAGLEAIIPSRRGHVARCLAFEGGRARAIGADRSRIEMTFANRAFARLWKRLNP